MNHFQSSQGHSTHFEGWIVPASVVYALLLVGAYWRLGENAATTPGVALQLVLLLPVWWLAWRQSAAKDGVWAPRQSAIWLIVVAFLCVAIPAGWYWGQGQLIPDEGTYAFEARILGSGHLTAESPRNALPNTAEARESVQFIHTIHYDGRWFGKYPPGWPAVLAVAQWFGLDPIANVLLAAAGLALAARLAAEIYGSGAGVMTAILMASCPLWFFTAMGRMAHALCGLLVIAGCYAAWRHIQTRRIGWAILCGLFIVFAFQVRAYTALVAGVWLAAFMLWHVRQSLRDCAATVAVWAGTGALAAGATLAWQYALTGSPWRSLYSLYLGAGSTVPPELWINSRTLVDNLTQRFRWTSINEFFFIGSLACATLVYAFFKGARTRVHPAWWVALVALLYAAHLPTTMPPGGRWGDRFHSESWFAIWIVAGYGASLLLSRLSVPGRRAAIAAFCGVQIVTLALYYPAFMDANRPMTVIRPAFQSVPEGSAVFLRTSRAPGVLPEHYNFWTTDWRTAPRVLLRDPGGEWRERVACGLGKSRLFAIDYDGATQRASISELPFDSGACQWR